MLRHIIEGSAKNPFLTGLLGVVILGWGTFALINTPLDAIPDLSDVQVILFTEFPGQAPQVVEDQVTYPLTTAMLSVPYATVVRAILSSAFPSSTSSSRTGPTSTGHAAACSST